MGRGRRLTISRSERFLGSYSYANINGDRDGGGSGESELVEEDVWSAIDDDSTGRPGGGWIPRAATEDHNVIPNGFARGHVGGLSLVFHDPSSYGTPTIVHQCQSVNDPSPSPRGRTNMARSAPLNVPDWSKILRVDSVDSLPGGDESDRVDDDDDIEENMVPPHEWAARGRNAGGLSVFGGVGRTLRGRDLRRVRDAVWSQTGFDG